MNELQSDNELEIGVRIETGLTERKTLTRAEAEKN
jgi:hypothetical protein